MQERIQKILARAGVASRRAAEELIEQGRVTVNGTVVDELGSKADPMNDHIKVDGKRITLPDSLIYVLLYKPKGVVSTVSDPEGRPVVTDLIRGVKGRFYPIGRLDFQSEGALLLTNDGDLMHKLLSPRSKCHKTYLVKVSGIPDAKSLARLERGVTIEGLRYAGCEISLFDTPKNAWLRVVLYEGKKHHLRKIFEHVGHPVSKLKRIAFAGIELGELEPGEFRTLTEAEVEALQKGEYGRSPDGLAELRKAGVPIKTPRPERTFTPGSQRSGLRSSSQSRTTSRDPRQESRTRRPDEKDRPERRPRPDPRSDSERDPRQSRNRSEHPSRGDKRSPPSSSRPYSKTASRPRTRQDESESDQRNTSDRRPSRGTERSSSYKPEGDRPARPRPRTGRDVGADSRSSRSGTSDSRSTGRSDSRSSSNSDRATRPERKPRTGEGPAASKRSGSSDRRPASSRTQSERPKHERPKSDERKFTTDRRPSLKKGSSRGGRGKK